MNKKLLAAAVAVAVASPAAFAESTVYGKFHTSIDAIDYETTNTDNYEVNSRASRLGFKGSEDLGNGLKAIYQLELGFNSTGDGPGQSGGNVFGSRTRNTFVGLSGDWGTVLVGRHDTPAKMAFYAAGTERLGDSVIDLNLGNNLTGTPSSLAPIGVFHEYRANDAIAYVSPNFSGFTIAAAVMPGEDIGNKTATSTTTGASICKNQRDGIADHYSVGLMYKGNGLRAGAGYASYDLDQCGFKATTTPLQPFEADSYEVAQIGASYTMNNFSFGGHYENSSNNPLPSPVASALLGNKGHDYWAWGLTGKATFGNNAVSLVYTDSKYEPDRAPGLDVDVERGGWGLSAEHNFSKRSKLYAAYASGEVKYGRDAVTVLGVKKKEKNDVFSLGMIHNF
jgi:predicted porin